jgi:hypothetical protein
VGLACFCSCKSCATENNLNLPDIFEQVMNEVENIVRNFLKTAVALILVYLGVQGVVKLSHHLHAAPVSPEPVNYALNKIAAANAAFAVHPHGDSIRSNYVNPPANRPAPGNYHISDLRLEP